MRRSERVALVMTLLPLAPLAALLALPVVGCSLLVGTDDLHAGPEVERDGAQSEAAQDGEADVTRDGSTPFADDGGKNDADTAVEGCEGAGRFCTGFDESAPASRWSRAYKVRGQITYDAPGLSAPNAMRAVITSGSGEAFAAVEKDLPANMGNVRCELDLKLESVPTGPGTETDVLDIVTEVPSGRPHNIYMASFGGNWTLAEYREGTSVDRTVDLGTLPIGVWLHVVLETTRRSATLTVDGRSVTLDSLTVPTNGTARGIHVGYSYVAPGVGTAAMQADNVDCTFSAD